MILNILHSKKLHFIAMTNFSKCKYWFCNIFQLLTYNYICSSVIHLDLLCVQEFVYLYKWALWECKIIHVALLNLPASQNQFLDITKCFVSRQIQKGYVYDFNFYDFAFLEDPCRRSYTFGFAHKLIPNGYSDYMCSIYLNKQALVK